MAKEVDLWTAEHPLDGKEGSVAVAPASVMSPGWAGEDSGLATKADEKRREGGSPGGKSRKVVYHVPL